MNFSIWKDVPIPINIKMEHIRKIGGRTYNRHITTCGDIPVAVYNDITGKMMTVENTRGNAYACRKRLKYRNKKK